MTNTKDRLRSAKLPAQILRNAGHSAYIVGGAVRDMVMGNEIHDIDMATDAEPLEVYKIFVNMGYKVKPIGLEFGTMLVYGKDLDEEFEITTFRKDGEYSDGRHPDDVEFTHTILEDLARRDLTINAMAYNPLEEIIIDPFGGQEDIKNRVLKAVGHSYLRFDEDALRMLRLARFAGKTGFSIEFHTELNARLLADNILDISIERVKAEMDKMMELPNTGRCIFVMAQLGLLENILPEVAATVGAEQPIKWHEFDVFNHTLKVLSNVEGKNLKYAALFHDIGKQKMRKDSPYFPRHEYKSYKMFLKIADRLKFSNADKKEIAFLIKQHMDFKSWKHSAKSMRKYLNKHGNLYVEDLFKLLRADVIGTGRKDPERLYHLQGWLDVYHHVNRYEPVNLKNLKVNGNDLIAAGVPKSHRISEILNILMQEVIQDPTRNNKAYLLERVGSLI